MHHGKYHMTIYRLQNIATKIMPVNERVNFFYKVAIFKVNNDFYHVKNVHFFLKLERIFFYYGKDGD